MRTFVLILATTLMATTTHAQAKSSSGSEILHQAPAGVSEATVGLQYHQQKIETSAGSSKYKGPEFEAIYQYGLNEDLSLGGRLSYLSVEDDSSPKTKQSGPGDWEFFLLGKSAAATGTLRYKATLGVSLEDSVYEANGDTNNYSGGNTLTPLIGYETALGGGLGGVYVSTEIGLGKRKYEDKGIPIKGKEKGGNSTDIVFYYESPLAQGGLFGGSVDYVTISKIKDDDGTSSEFATPNLVFSVYSAHPAGPGIFLPKLSYATTLDSRVNGVDLDKFTRLTLGAQYRLLF